MLDLPFPISVEEALEPTDVHIRVPDGETLTMGPFEPNFNPLFRVAAVTRFDDLYRLGFVHESVTETDARDAIRADDKSFREISFRNQIASGVTQSCSCEGNSDSTMRAIKRTSYQDHLIEVLQPLFSLSLDARNPAVLHTYRQLTRFFSAVEFYVGLFRLEDITIGNRATLVMTPSVSALFAGTISIGDSGTLRFQAGAVHVRCAALNGPSPFTQTTTNLAKFGRYLPGAFREQRNQDASSNH